MRLGAGWGDTARLTPSAGHDTHPRASGGTDTESRETEALHCPASRGVSQAGSGCNATVASSSLSSTSSTWRGATRPGKGTSISQGSSFWRAPRVARRRSRRLVSGPSRAYIPLRRPSAAARTKARATATGPLGTLRRRQAGLQMASRAAARRWNGWVRRRGMARRVVVPQSLSRRPARHTVRDRTRSIVRARIGTSDTETSSPSSGADHPMGAVSAWYRCGGRALRASRPPEQGSAKTGSGSRPRRERGETGLKGKEVRPMPGSQAGGAVGRPVRGSSGV